MSIQVEFQDEHPNGTVGIVVRRERDGEILRMAPAEWRGITWQPMDAPGLVEWARVTPEVLDAIAFRWVADRLSRVCDKPVVAVVDAHAIVRDALDEGSNPEEGAK